jgi:hypothetical protein
MKYKMEHKPKTPRSEEKYLVLDTENPYPVGNPLHSSWLGWVVAECDSKKTGQLVMDALNHVENCKHGEEK